MRLKPRLRTTLEAEGVLIDPIGALLAAAVLQVVTRPAVDTLASEAGQIAASLSFGVVAGLGTGLFLVLAIRYRVLVAGGYEHIFTLAAVVLLFEASGAVVRESGLMAVTVAGIVVGNFDAGVVHEIREFKDRLTVMLVGVLFVLLAANVALADVRALGRPGLLVVAGLVILVRPLAVWTATTGLSISTRERMFVAAAVASITAGTLDAQGIAGGPELVALVFLVIATTVVVSGLTARPLAGLLDARLPRRDRVAILGARGLAMALADQLRAAQLDVVFLESDPKRSRVAEEAGYPVVFGDALDERTMLRSRPELVGTAIGLTFNEHFNSLFVRQAIGTFAVPQGLIAMESLFGEQTESLVPQERADVLFDGPHDHERWDVRWRHGDVVVETFTYEGPPETEETEEHPTSGMGSSAVRSQELFVIVAVTRGKRISPMRMGYVFKEGDEAAIALYTPQHDEALAQLVARGWQPKPPESPEEGAQPPSSVLSP